MDTKVLCNPIVSPFTSIIQNSKGDQDGSGVKICEMEAFYKIIFTASVCTENKKLLDLRLSVKSSEAFLKSPYEKTLEIKYQ